MNIHLSSVICVMRPQSLKMTIHLLYRAYNRSKLAAGCRRQQPNIRGKGSSASTSPLLDQTHKLIDLLESMFGDADIEDLDPEYLEMSKVKDLCQATAQVEEASVSKEHGPIPSDGITQDTVKSTPVPLEFGIPEISIPLSENVKIPSTTNPIKRITRFYYHCRHCTKSAQNKASMMTHTHHCINIKLVCGKCGKEYDSSVYIEKHINKMHGNDIDMA